jgi:crotonobetainyl-CoA:carnitine CoA-transferase CaiB-like acyl-CoA transferase
MPSKPARKTTASHPGLLSGLRVVEIGQRIAGPVASMVLAEQGAEVVRVVDTSHPERDPLMAALLARGKTEVALDLGAEDGREALRQLVLAADVVIENRDPGTMDRLGLDFDAIRADHNPLLISCSIPNFAPGDPRERLPDYEAIVGTAGYLFEKPIGAPQVHDFPLGSVIAALFSATGIVGALVSRLRTGRGQHVSAVVTHADIFAQVVLVLMNTGIPRGFLPLKMVGTPFMGSWLCGDGRYIYMHMSLPAHAALIMDVLEEAGYGDEVAELRVITSEETLRDPSQVKSIPEAKAIKEVYRRIFLTRSAMEWEELLGKQLCCMAVRTVDEWIPATIEAGMADAGEVEDPVFGPVHVPGASVTIDEFPPIVEPRIIGGDAKAIARNWKRRKQRHGPVDGRDLEPELNNPLEGIRVMDIARVIAGPCAARILAELGAEVLTIQRPTRLDWALTFHLLFNAGKKHATIDTATEEGKRQLWAVMEEFQPHAFIQNYRHMKLARKIGVGPEHLRAKFPKIAYTHLNAYGNLGSWADQPGFEQVVQAVSGIQMTYGGGEKPKLLPSPVIDIGSGLLGAFGTALGIYHQLRTGESTVSSTHLTRTAVLYQVLPIARAQRERCLAAAAARGEQVDYDPGAQIVEGILRARDAFFCVAGPRRDVVAWLRWSGLGEDPSDGSNPLDGVSKKVWSRSVAHWQQDIHNAGLASRVAVLTVPAIKRMLSELPKLDFSEPPPVERRDYSGIDQQLTFIRNPIRLSDTPMADVQPAAVRGEHTPEVLARIGATPPPDYMIPYPEAKPLHVWTATLIRWGYFAWRSGNI